MHNDLHKYDDIINLEHHVSKKHLPMSISNRAAQFAPFAALTGYEDAIGETARVTDKKIELDDNGKALLDEKIKILQELLNGSLVLPKEIPPQVKIAYFKKDEKKSGGAYVEQTGVIKKIDAFSKKIIMEKGEDIPILDIVDIDGEMLYNIENIFDERNTKYNS